MAVPGDAVAVLAAKFAVMRQVADERTWRVYLGSEARALGHGGIVVVARAAGVSETTVAAGVAEIEAGGLDGLPPGRSRRPGGGRRKAEDAQPGLTGALRGLVEAATRGDPVAEITWCSLSLRDIGRQMAGLGFRCGKDALARMMREDGYSLQGMSRTIEGRQHPDRDAQFRRINAMIAGFRAAGDPVVSVDAKKKEQLGPFWRAGRTWRPAGDPVRVRDHDFPDHELGKITPYGIYDIAANRGFVSVGTSCDTAAFAVSALRLWWKQEGSLRYPGAGRLLVTCDAGGSNSYKNRAWKDQLAALAAETGLQIWVCHFPPGTSKWNKIEHRLFCHITRTWRGRPLMTPEDAVAGIAATTTYAGLKVIAVLDENEYPKGEEVSGQRMKYLEECLLDRGAVRGEWNYAVLPAPRPAPEPEPEPERPGRCPQAALNHPALTGMDPGGLLALAAALDVPFGARREQRNYAKRGHRRVNALRNGDGSNGRRRIDLTDHVLAWRLREHLRLPVQAIGVLLGIGPSTASHAAALTARLLAGSGIPQPATAPPPDTLPRTPGELLDYTAAAGITLIIPDNGQTMPAHFRTRGENLRHARS
jgi:Rhodopirellula transposase DDE domain